MRSFLAIIIVFFIFSFPAQAEAPLGDWLCTGQSPGDNRTYKGHVSVIRSGETFTVMWRFGTSTFIGTGLEMGDHFAVSFMKTGSQEVGLVLLKKQGEQWLGQWTPMGGQSIGQEKWARMGAPNQEVPRKQ